jgi:flavodoxin
MKVLVIYYSWSNGNTKLIADMICKMTGADTVKVETVIPYTGTYDEVVNQGQDEVSRGYKPEIREIENNLDSYDMIFIGTPTWWYTMAPAMLTFLSSVDWRHNRNVALYMTNGGWPGHVIKDMEKICHEANIVGNMEIQFDSTGGSKMITSANEIEDWIRKCVMNK